ncbi:Crp/Fnr family transcriptional regulator [Streptomyces sp. NPDC048410]|uniref:Crp/Fnr family transcriptional regulator n=1 Tax=Streptomyces sp. NPDC048410 TaxID=3365545 RepID=UPI0037237A9B
MSEDHIPSVSSLRALVSHEEWTELTSRTPQTYLPGEVLLEQGSSGTHVLALEEGLVKVVRTDRDGRRRLLAFRGPGEVLGEMALQCGGERLADVWAMSKCKASIVLADDFRRFVHDHQLADRLAVMASHRLREQTEIHDGAVHERLAMTLLRLVEVSGGESSFSLIREELGEHIGAGRKAVSKALEQLGPGAVRAGRSRIEVISVEGLRKAISDRNDT